MNTQEVVEKIELFPNKDYDSASSEVMDYIKDKIK